MHSSCFPCQPMPRRLFPPDMTIQRVKSTTSKNCGAFHPHVTISLLSPNILLSTHFETPQSILFPQDVRSSVISIQSTSAAFLLLELLTNFVNPVFLYCLLRTGISVSFLTTFTSFSHRLVFKC
jgi:hypothetical protein